MLGTWSPLFSLGSSSVVGDAGHSLGHLHSHLAGVNYGGISQLSTLCNYARSLLLNFPTGSKAVGKIKIESFKWVQEIGGWTFSLVHICGWAVLSFSSLFFSSKNSVLY